MKRRRWFYPFLLCSATNTAVVATSATNTCQGRCSHCPLVQHQLPPHQPGTTQQGRWCPSGPWVKRHLQLVTPPSQEAAPSSCALARPAAGTNEARREGRGKDKSSCKTEQACKGEHGIVTRLLGCLEGSSCISDLFYPVLGVSLVCKTL